MKGVSFEIEEMMKLFLVLIIGLGIVILVIATSGAISALINQFCERNPDICGGVFNGPSEEEHALAASSVNALKCAINSVARGIKDEASCSGVLTTSSTIPTGNMIERPSFSGFATLGSEQVKQPSIDCGEKSIEKKQFDAKKIIFSVSIVNPENREPEKYFGCKPYYPNGDKGLQYGWICFSCEDGKRISVKTQEIPANFIERVHNTEREKINQYQSIYDYCKPIVQGGLIEYYDFYKCQNSKPKENYKYKSECPTGGWIEDNIVPQCEVITGATCEVITKYSYQCVVSNFNLPQQISAGEVTNIIRAYGDPYFIAYWQVFPIEQDTWTFKVDWKIHAAIILVTALPPMKVAGTLTKFGFSKVVSTITKEEAKRTLKQEMTNIAIMRLRDQKIRMAVKGAVLEGAAWALGYADSKNAKYEPAKNSFVLKSPFQNKEPFGLVSEVEGKPVLLQWKTGDLIGGGAIDVAHFVSPCKIQSMDVVKGSVTCEEYFANSDAGTIQCIKLAKMEKPEEGNLWSRITGYVKSMTPDKPEPTCDIKKYMEENEPFLNDINQIKAAKVEGVAKKLFGEDPQLKPCKIDETNNLIMPYTDTGVNYKEDYIEQTYKKEVKLPSGKTYVVSGCYENDPKKLDRIEIKEKDGARKIMLLDTDYNGDFESYILYGCKTDAVIITNVKPSATNGDYNYCYDTTARYLSIGQASTYAAALGTAVIIAVAFPPSTILEAAGVLGTITVTQQSAETVIKEIEQARGKWPGPKGG